MGAVCSSTTQQVHSMTEQTRQTTNRIVQEQNNVEPTPLASIPNAPSNQSVEPIVPPIVTGDWSVPHSGGYLSIQNPQILIQPQCSGTLTIRVSRTDSGPITGFIFAVFASESRLLSPTNPLTKSSYTVTKQLQVSLPVEARKCYVILVSLQTPNTDFSFQVESIGVPLLQNVVLPLNKQISVQSVWEKQSAAGYGKPENPQFRFQVDSTSPKVITLERTDGADHCGMKFIIMKGITRKNWKKCSLSDVVFESAYMTSNKIEAIVNLEVTPVPYIIMPFLERAQIEGPFRITIEGSPEEQFSLQEIYHQPIVYKENSCEHILQSFKTDGDIFYDQNPVDAIITACKQTNTVFADAIFPLNKDTINKPSPYKLNAATLPFSKFLRPLEVCENPCLFSNGIDCEDINQGFVGDCWLVGSIASIASIRSEIISSLFYPQNYSKYGVYSLKLFDKKTKKFRYVIIDDVLTYNVNGKLEFVSSKDTNELWPSLLEKAFAKIFEGYKGIQGRSNSVAFETITGGDCQYISIEPENQVQTWQQLLFYYQNKWLLSCCTIPCSAKESEKIGIVSEHAYSILKVIEKYKLVLLRNPWGYSEKYIYSGAFGKKDTKRWTSALKKELEFDKLDKASFYVTYDDFVIYFKHVFLCKLLDDYTFRMNLNGNWSKSLCGGYMKVNNPTYLFTVSQVTKCFLTLVKQDTTTMGMIFFICKQGSLEDGIMDEYDVLIKSPYLSSNEIKSEFELAKGSYELVCCLQYANRHVPFLLHIIATHEMQIQQLK